MNSLADLLKRLNHISEAADEKCPKCDCAPCECDDKDKVDESKKKKPDADGDGIPDWADEDNNKKEVKETALSLLRRYAGIQEATIEEDQLDELSPDLLKRARDKAGEKWANADDRGDKKASDKYNRQDDKFHSALRKKEKSVEEGVEEGNEFSGALKAAKDAGEDEFEVGGKKYKVNECGDMPMTNQMSPITAVTNMGVPAQIEMPHAEMEVEPESEERPMFTLNVRNGDNNLSMTTDSPDEIIHVMKLAGVNKTAEVTKTPAADQEKEVDESGYANTPSNTRERDPKGYGDIRDWGMKGTATAKTHSIPAKQGDNPLGEQAMMEDYKKI